LIQPNPGRIAHAIAAIYNPELAPELAKPIEDKEPQETAFAKELVNKATAGKLESTSFTPEAWKSLAGNVGRVSEFLRDLGPLKTIELLERTEQEGNRVSRYRLRYSDTNTLLVIGINKDGKIARLNLQLE